MKGKKLRIRRKSSKLSMKENYIRIQYVYYLRVVMHADIFRKTMVDSNCVKDFKIFSGIK